uniref:Reverse transcriptase domain-containing protein n=1 Tax=Tanacetum cinerariifolium TaxID=118510 RepID=A0A6L2L0F5_TANCI|nr:reverse transcriptase domain-containing protein [Tanacetum cinerariifolium]
MKLAEVSTHVPIVEEVGTQEFTVEDVVLKDYVSSEDDAELGNGQEDESTPTDRQFFYDDEVVDTAYESKYDIYSSKDASTDDDDEDEDFLVDEENKILEPDVDVYLFGISMDLPFNNINVTNIVLDDVLEGEDVDVINADGFDSEPGNNDETNDYRRRRPTKLSKEMEGVINASGQWKYSFYTGKKFTTPKEAKDRVYLHSIKSRKNLKLYKNDSVRIRARCDGKVNLDIPVKVVQDQYQCELEVQISMSKAFRAKAKAEREIKKDHVLQYSMLRDNVVELQSTNPNTTVKIVVKRNTNPSLPTMVFQRIYATVRLDSNNGIYPLTYALVEAERIPCKHTVTACWNMALNDRVAPPPEAWVGRPRKKRKRSKNEDEPFVKDGGSGAGAVIGLSAAAGQGGVGVGSQGSSHIRWTKRRIQTERISPQKRTPTQPASQPSTSSQVLVSETRNVDGREMGDGIPTQSSAAGGASKWSLLVDVIDEILEEDFDALLDEGSKIPYFIKGTLLEEEIFAEFDEFWAMIANENSESESDTEEPPFKKIAINNNYKIKTSLKEPPTDLELKLLPNNSEYVFLEEPSPPPPHILGICPSFCKHKIQILDDKKPIVQKQISPWVSPIYCVPKKGGITVVTNKNDEQVPTRTVTGWRVCIDYRKLNEATAKDRFPLTFMDQMLERLARNKFFCFLDGLFGYFQTPIDPIDQEKTTFTCPFRTYAYRRMPFELCNAPATFQRCMLEIFHDMIEVSVEVFMDDFSVFGESFDKCLNNLDKMLQRCKDAHLVLNWEKCHFMVKEGIVLGHKVSSARLKVDKAKINVISKLPPLLASKVLEAFLDMPVFTDFSLKISQKLPDL